MALAEEACMHSPLQRLVSWLVSALPTAAILAALGMVGWWGNTHDWQWNPTEKKEEKKEEEAPTPLASDKAPLPVVKIDEKAATEAGIATEPARRESMGEYVTANGEIDYNQNRYAHLTTRLTGIVWQVDKRPGDRVRQGDLLALIAAAELARLKNDLQLSMHQVEHAKMVLKRRQNASGALAGEQIHEAELALREGQIRTLNYRQSLENLGLDPNTDQLSRLSEEEISEQLRLLGVRPDEISSQGRKGPLPSNLLPMRVPFDGEVIQRDMVRGEMVSPGPAHFVLADLSKLWLRLYVPQEEQARMKRGLKVRFRQNGVNEETPEATVVYVSAEVDAKTRTLPVYAEVDNKELKLRPHTFGVGRIRIGAHDAVVVADNAVQWDGRSSLVFVKKSAEEYQPYRIRVGAKDDGKTELLPLSDSRSKLPIHPGDEVVTTGSHIVKSEMQKARIAGED
jgi:cobalt-zinc-cadmium efflux system membrane fusion protein